jgi:uncharacterized membrane protein
MRAWTRRHSRKESGKEPQVKRQRVCVVSTLNLTRQRQSEQTTLMSRRFQFSLRALLVAMTFCALIGFFVRELVRSSGTSGWLRPLLTYCALWASIVALLVMLNGTTREGIWMGLFFFLMAAVSMPLIALGIRALSFLL